MSDFTSIDPQTMATQLASYDVMALQAALKKQQTSLTGQQDALKALKSAMTDFRTALTALNKTNNGLLTNKVTTSLDNIANVTANSNATKGTYNLYVEQLAGSHQVAFDEMTDDAVKGATGTFTLEVNGKSIDIEMDGLETMSDLARAINKTNDGSENSPAITASLIRTDGEVKLMLSSDKTGAENELKLSGDIPAAMDTGKTTTISEAKDAIVYLGGKDSGLKITNSTNKLDGVIEGVTVELNQAQKDGDAPLRINVNTDTSETETQVKAFIDAYNTMRDSLGKLTASGSGGTDRGAFAGDAGIASLERELNNMIRTNVDGLDMTKFGITADKDGKLELDSEKLEKMLTDNPTQLTALFNGNDGLIKKMDKSLDKYLNSTNGVIKGRQESLDRQETQLTDRSDKISTRYENSYNRYLKQFTQLQQVMSQMNNTMSMFGLV